MTHPHSEEPSILIDPAEELGRIVAHAVLEAARYALEMEEAETPPETPPPPAEVKILPESPWPFPPSIARLTSMSDAELQDHCCQSERECDAAEAAFKQARKTAAQAIEEIARRGIAAEYRYRQAAESSGGVMPEVDAQLMATIRQEMGLDARNPNAEAAP